jgi:hypothetical protein
MVECNFVCVVFVVVILFVVDTILILLQTKKVTSFQKKIKKKVGVKMV